MSILDFILSFVPPAGRVAALRAPAEVEVTVARNPWGGWSIYAANDRARALLGGDEPTGNFGTYAAAHARAADHNCWRVVEAPTLPGMTPERRPALSSSLPARLPANAT